MNKLVNASSPYLIQHANNPVEWYEWGEEALSRARGENKPIIISIGYGACHWCHVMAHESFEDPLVADFMNSHFICIKVDREERPDIDAIYMEAAHLITGRGGWPLNAFATPDGRPFFAGTYFQKKQWFDLLKQISIIYNSQYYKIDNQADELTKAIKIMPIFSHSMPYFSKEKYNKIFAEWKDKIDFEMGGLDSSPKFPMPATWEFLLQYFYFTGDTDALKAVRITLDKMACGGIYDHVGGGFSRYATDPFWKIPHFEKMLYDNAQLVSLYSHAYQVTHQYEYAEIVQQTLRFIERELTHPDGGFYSSLNADSEGEEGKFYVWSRDEIKNLFDSSTSSLIESYYQITTSGNWEKNRNVIHTKLSKEEFASKHNLTVPEFMEFLNKVNSRLYNYRNKRSRPSTDDKVLASWNALMLMGYLDAYIAIGDVTYLEVAINNAVFIENNLIQKDNQLWRNFRNGQVSVPAFLDDYALVAEAFIKLYENTFEMHWLDVSHKLVDYVLDHFNDEKSGLFFYTSDVSENIITRRHEVADNVIPSSNSVFAHVLYRLGTFLDRPSYKERSHAMLGLITNHIFSESAYYGKWASLYGLLSYGHLEVAIMGDRAAEKNLALQKTYLPDCLFCGGQHENLPLLKDKTSKEGTLIYVCRDKTCKVPVNNVMDALAQIRDENH